MGRDPIGHFVYLDRPPEEPGYRCDPAIRDAAGDDQREIVEVGIHVEREPVAGYPAGDADADGRQLLATDPDAGQALHALGRNPVVARRANEDLFEIADVAMDVASIGIQI